jgi:hypothetical protein
MTERDPNSIVVTTAPATAHPVIPRHRPAAVARILALAHHLDAALERGTLKNRTELSRQLGFVTTRVSQILNLVRLAPDIQDDVLHLQVSGLGPEPLRACDLEGIARLLDWSEQRRAYAELRPSSSVEAGASS